MTKFFTSTDTLRSLIGAAAAVLLAGTFLVAAAGPAVAGTNSVNSPSISNIVRSA